MIENTLDDLAPSTSQTPQNSLVANLNELSSLNDLQNKNIKNNFNQNYRKNLFFYPPAQTAQFQFNQFYPNQQNTPNFNQFMNSFNPNPKSFYSFTKPVFQDKRQYLKSRKEQVGLKSQKLVQFLY